MLRENLHILKKLVFAADLCLVALAFQVTALIENIHYGIYNGLFSADDLMLPAAIIWGLVLWFQPECYVFRLKRIGDIIKNALRASLISAGLFLIYVQSIGYIEWNRFHLVFSVGLVIFFLILLRFAILSLLQFYRKRGFNYQTVLIVGTGSIARDFADKILNNLHFGIKIIGFIDWSGRAGLWRYRDIPCVARLEDLPELLKRKQVDYVVYAVDKNCLGVIEDSIKICEEMGVRVSIVADFFDLRLARRRVDSFFGAPLISYDSAPAFSLPMCVKAILDKTLAAAGIIVAAPVMLLAALAVRITSAGPVIFRQPRCGLNGRKFTLYKFRTMVQNAEELKGELLKYNEIDGAAFKITNDPRITPVGRFLRKASVDELPQLFNILRGDMSFVGPRPPLAEEVVHYDLWQRRKLSMKPGLTCLWQVSGRSNVSFKEWMKLDLEYIDNWSLLKDAEILVKTVPAVLRGAGAK